MRILVKSLAASAVFALVLGSGSAAVASKAIPKQGKAIPKTSAAAIPKSDAIPKGGAIPKQDKAIPKAPAIP